MKKYISSVLAAALVSTLMVGCSDSNNNETVQDAGFNGVFVDRPVDGVSFACRGVDNNPLAGVTHNGGLFGVCATGSTVSFSVGNVVLGEMEQSENNIFTPRDIAEGDDAEANQIASLILSLSTTTVNDAGETVLTIGPAAIAALNLEVPLAIDIETISAETLADTIEAVVENETTDLVQITPEEAESHMDETAEEILDGTITQPEQPELPATTGAN